MAHSRLCNPETLGQEKGKRENNWNKARGKAPWMRILYAASLMASDGMSFSGGASSSVGYICDGKGLQGAIVGVSIETDWPIAVRGAPPRDVHEK